MTVKAIRRDHWQAALVKSGHSHGETLYVKWLQEFRMQEIFLRYENVWANINLEAELVEIQKRLIMSPAKLIYKVIKKYMLMQFKSSCLDSYFPFPFELGRCFCLILFSLSVPFGSHAAILQALTIRGFNAFLNDKIKQRSRDYNGLCGTITNGRWR